MMETEHKAGLTGVDLLAVAFIVLKLCGVIQWKWVWVLLPIWSYAALALVATVIIAIVEK